RIVDPCLAAFSKSDGGTHRFCHGDGNSLAALLPGRIYLEDSRKRYATSSGSSAAGRGASSKSMDSGVDRTCAALVVVRDSCRALLRHRVESDSETSANI